MDEHAQAQQDAQDIGGTIEQDKENLDRHNAILVKLHNNNPLNQKDYEDLNEFNREYPGLGTPSSEINADTPNLEQVGENLKQNIKEQSRGVVASRVEAIERMNQAQEELARRGVIDPEQYPRDDHPATDYFDSSEEDDSDTD